MSHKRITDLGSWYSNFDISRMEPGKYYQLRGWSAVTLEEYNGDTCVTLYSYDACILRYDIAENAFHAVQFERPYDVSTTTSRHISEFFRFLRFAVNHEGQRFEVYKATTDYPLKHTPNEWYFYGLSGDYTDKPFWW